MARRAPQPAARSLWQVEELGRWAQRRRVVLRQGPHRGRCRPAHWVACRCPVAARRCSIQETAREIFAPVEELAARTKDCLSGLLAAANPSWEALAAVRREQNLVVSLVHHW